MFVLRVDLQEGFEGEPVVVTVNGREAFRKPSVRTRTQIGLAESFELTLADGDLSIEVSARGRTARFSVSLHDTVNLGISVTQGGEIVHRVSSEPFGYL